MFLRGTHNGWGHHRQRQVGDHTWRLEPERFIVERHGYRTPAQIRSDQLNLAEAA